MEKFAVQHPHGFIEVVHVHVGRLPCNETDTRRKSPSLHTYEQCAGYAVRQCSYVRKSTMNEQKKKEKHLN